MKSKIFTPPIVLLSALLLYCCKSNNPNRSLNGLNSDTASKSLNATRKLSDTNQSSIIPDSNFKFVKSIYLKIDKIYSGQTFTDKSKDVFYRVLEVPAEENLSLYSEYIAMGDEGGDFRLIKRVRLTDDDSVFPKFGLNNIDSLKFIDSITIEGYFNKEKIKLNLRTLQKK